jgi:hypothetical protein
LLKIDPAAASHPAVITWSTDRQWMDELLRHHLHRGKNRMKKQTDQHRSERHFAVGDLVYLKLQPYVQTSLAPRSHHKLAFRFFGPFRTALGQWLFVWTCRSIPQFILSFMIRN